MSKRRPDRRTTPRKPRTRIPADCLEWARRFLPEHFRDEPAAFHRELMHDLTAGARLIARVAPRGHAKSTCAALAYPLWRLCEGLSRNILIITHERSLATQFVRDIRNEIEANEHIADAYGDLTRTSDPPEKSKQSGRKSPVAPKRRKWSEAFFTAANGVSIQARGSGTSLRGCRVGADRPDLIICDDIEKDQQVRSAQGRKKLEYWLRRVVMPALAPGGQLVIIGSLLHFDSLLANLAKPGRWRLWDYKMYRAIEAAQGDDGELYRVALWPARWPLEKLDEERERVGTIAFEQEYMANPINEDAQIFRPEWLQTYDPAELIGRESNLANLIAVDPATGTSEGDYCAIWVGSVDTSTGVIFTRELRLARINIVQQVARIIAAYKKWKPELVGIETTGYQMALKDILEDECRKRGLYIPIRALNTHDNKIARVQGLSAFFENGTFRLPPGLDPEVEAQFLNFPKGGHDDAPDVCVMALDLAREFRAAGRIEALIGGAGRFENRGAW